MANNVRGLIINSLKQYHDEIKDSLITSSERTNWNSYANVQADWNVSDTSSNAYIKNKPQITNELPTYSSSDSGKVLSVNSSGQLVWITPVSIYTGSGDPSNSMGNDGDIYLQS